MARNKPRLLFYFLHLLGVGHVYRAKRLIEGFAKAGIAVDVIYGGKPVPNISFEAESLHYLPPICATDASYAHYIDETGKPLERPYQDLRAEKLLEIFEGLTPDLILTEAFPFGRRMVRHEMRALIDAANARQNPPLIVSSVRDILHEGRKPGRNEETRDWINDCFDHVLVHSDPAIIKLDATFPLASEIQNRLSYTGFVVPQPEQATKTKAFDVIVSAGGGAFGGDLMTAALKTANAQPTKRWCLICGPNLPENTAAYLRENAPPHVAIKPSVKNLAAHMKAAKVSVSQCGYNTAMDALTAHRDSACRAVFVPYDQDGQTEQLRRSILLEEAGYSINLPQSKLTTENLNAAIEKAAQLPRVDHAINFDGVTNSARLVRQWIENKS